MTAAKQSMVTFFVSFSKNFFIDKERYPKAPRLQTPLKDSFIPQQILQTHSSVYLAKTEISCFVEQT